ncbi:acyl-CoA dehydrogenase [Novosphingobium sp. FSY-8]|uniref:Acyl-CoA dehydrogenase n=1 Tax=Novosphingobium ovatum TaxID=1908523 RepID=A0ABW9XDA3_9SPHN|nr:acyl-CoA dehydrogenase family protein [Novosphingobium ovatum]NBC36524.1 acyl-CoA dehydrogenase [Novosphingobium ovatum]
MEVTPVAIDSVIARHLTLSPGWDQVRAASDTFAQATDDMVAEVLNSAGRFGAEHLAPLNAAADVAGCRLVDGRVLTVAEHKSAWEAFREQGWLMLDASPEIGGMGLPTALANAVQEMMDRHCPAFGMMPVPSRAGTRLLHAFGDEATKAAWLPSLIEGTTGATICISEPDAGSDVRRLRTRGTRNADGTWSITGEKCWISFGDQDVTPRIAHFLLAKTAPEGQAPSPKDPISLFLVPSEIDGTRQPIVVRRIEEKLGLHASPTCVMGFEGATGYLLGEVGRGLPQLFVMITNMRLATGVMGLAIGSKCADIAHAYAADRRQGGNGPQPVAINDHADVQLQVLSMAARVETLRGMVFATANAADIARTTTDADEKARCDALAGWLLPIIKTLGGEVGFGVASDAIQVLGGAGYTREWPVEQGLRDARVLTVFEGTTGMQAQDLTLRRLRAPGAAGLEVFLRHARADAEALGVAGAWAQADALAQALDTFETTARQLAAADQDQRDIESGATAFLNLAGIVASGWIAARLMAAGQAADADPIARRLAAAGRFALSDIAPRATLAAHQALAGADRITGFDTLCAG